MRLHTMVSGLEQHSQTTTKLAGPLLDMRATSVGGWGVRRGRGRMGEKG